MIICNTNLDENKQDIDVIKSIVAKHGQIATEVYPTISLRFDQKANF
jgi:hypothetical protein